MGEQMPLSGNVSNEDALRHSHLDVDGKRVSTALDSECCVELLMLVRAELKHSVNKLLIICSQ